MKKIILLLALAFWGFSGANAQQIDLGTDGNITRCGDSSFASGSGSTGSGYVECNNCSPDAGFIVQADKDLDESVEPHLPSLLQVDGALGMKLPLMFPAAKDNTFTCDQRVALSE